MIWRIADADSTLWVFGSIHALPADLAWRRPALDAALADADVVFFETLDDGSDQTAIDTLITQLSIAPPGQRLSQLLDQETRALYLSVIEELRLDRHRFETLQPWVAALTIDLQSATYDGQRLTTGVDDSVERAARALGKDIRALETGESQVRALADHPLDVQLAVLEATLTTFRRNPNGFDRFLNAWMDGDVRAMAALNELDFGAMPASFVATLLDDRNRAWAEQLHRWMSGDGVALVIVGAGHLVGPNNLIALMEARGHAVDVR